MASILANIRRRTDDASRVAKVLGNTGRNATSAAGIIEKAYATPTQKERDYLADEQGRAEGNRAAPRLDKPAKFAKGGRVKGGSSTTVNVIIPPQGGSETPAPDPMAAAKALAMAAGPRPAPASPMPPQAMGAPPPGMPAGGPQLPTWAAALKPPGMKTGGRVPHMTAGAASGEGRLQKTAIQKRAR